MRPRRVRGGPRNLRARRRPSRTRWIWTLARPTARRACSLSCTPFFGSAVAEISLGDGFSAPDRPQPPLERRTPGGQVLLGRTEMLEEREGALAERLAL